jgi:hypothetical protein
MRLLFLLCMLVASVAPMPAGLLYDPCGSVAGNLVTNCGFETGDFTGWTSAGSSQNTSVETGTYAQYSANSGAYFAVLGPSTTGTLSQTFSTNSGATYAVSFYLASVGDNPSDFTALWDGSSLSSLTNPNSGLGYTQFVYFVTGTGSDTLQFSFQDVPGWMALDDVAVVNTVPEPGTMGPLIAGLAAVILSRRRRFT